jgi:hypothetical protein
MSNQLSTGDLVAASNWNEVERKKATGATVATSETETNTAYDDMATVGPAVTVTTGTKALVHIGADVRSAAGQTSLVSVAVSGASTIAATDARALSSYNGDVVRGSRAVLVTGLTAGSNTFTLKYRVTGGTGTFIDREIIVIPQD